MLCARDGVPRRRTESFTRRQHLQATNSHELMPLRCHIASLMPRDMITAPTLARLHQDFRSLLSLYIRRPAMKPVRHRGRSERAIGTFLALFREGTPFAAPDK